MSTKANVLAETSSLDALQQKYIKAVEELVVIVSARTAIDKQYQQALDTLNSIQNALDQTCQKLKQKAPLGSNWSRKRTSYGGW